LALAASGCGSATAAAARAVVVILILVLVLFLVLILVLIFVLVLVLLVLVEDAASAARSWLPARRPCSTAAAPPLLHHAVFPQLEQLSSSRNMPCLRPVWMLESTRYVLFSRIRFWMAGVTTIIS
jgi:hypothetical protein